MMRLSSATVLACALALLTPLVEAATARPKGDFRECIEITPNCPLEATLYGYSPILSVNAFFVAIFGLCFVASLGIGILNRTWTYTIAMGIGTLFEAAGYGGRLMMVDNPWSESGFRLQIVCLVLGPSLIAAAIYLTLKHFVLYCGPQYSLIKARLYPWVFIGCDIGSIALQSIGGGLAAAGGKNNFRLVNAGNNMIVAGIAFQVATMAVCGLLMVVYILRYRKSARKDTLDEKSSYQIQKEQGTVATWKVKVFGSMVVLAYTTVLIRCIYRLPEMAGGWGNPLMRNEQEFLLLDGMMIAIACVALTVFHPAYYFPPFATFRMR
ncbi:RTA1-domain-containing protein [Dothidotthia symphoricarpi CBS 119687]|uniref:RTA1-domain-containing protein n=1 Tax=Dothidotthia symphoricarpi CBS 119687 TaxID=1392245 RepID=A0A6A5ZXF4_9PLEO|nr:RTA1-domain-containing protein [Dothidotthia symphoricarpi CBS 119687]KAF2124209.1 RTA1-domain-containing protein [Dothidotthia symphoricarpi CBS 119687]